MSRLRQQSVDVFSKEIEKMALSDVGRSAATLGVVGSLLGGGIGYKKAREEGEGIPGSLLQAGEGALVGAGGGAALGAGVGGASRLLRGAAPAVLHSANPTEVTPWYKALDKYVGDFGQRARHAITGYVPEGQSYENFVKDVGIGGRGVMEPLEKHPYVMSAQKELAEAQANPNWWNRLTFKDWRAGRGVDRAKALAGSAQKLIGHQATSIPGWFRALGDPARRGDVLRESISGQWHGMGLPMKALTALGVASMVPAVTGNLPPGIGRGEAIGQSLGSMSGMMVPFPMPAAGQFALQPALSTLGRYAGKGADYLTGHGSRKALDPSDPLQATDRQWGPEVMMSPSAAGKPYGSGIT
jgi:hypothetical protein